MGAVFVFIDAPVVGSVDDGVGTASEEAGTEESEDAIGFGIDFCSIDSTINWVGAVAVAGGVEAMGF